VKLDFQYTVTSIFRRAADLPIEREFSLGDLLVRYEQQEETLAHPDRQLVQEAAMLLEQRLPLVPLDVELMALALAIYSHMGRYDDIISLLQVFLAGSRTTKERAWARWLLCDNLALAGRYCEAVHEQQQFLAWVEAFLPAEDCLFAISDGTQALGWVRMEQAAAWLSHCNRLLVRAHQTERNRLERFYTLRSAAMVCICIDDLVGAYRYGTLIQALLRENEHWPEFAWVDMEARILEMKITDREGRMTDLQTLAQQAIHAFEQWEGSLDKENRQVVERFRSLCHNMGAPLYRIRRYDLAMPLFEKAIRYQTTVYYSYVWLAACMWQTTGQRERVLSLLRQAGARYNGTGAPWDAFRQLPEFEDVQDDLAFQEAANAECV
jgi:tetratricopeptide (TPR) repeat protein